MKNIIDITTGEVILISDETFNRLLINGLIFFSSEEREYFFHTIFKKPIIGIINKYKNTGK